MSTAVGSDFILESSQSRAFSEGWKFLLKRQEERCRPLFLFALQTCLPVNTQPGLEVLRVPVKAGLPESSGALEGKLGKEMLTPPPHVGV